MDTSHYARNNVPISALDEGSKARFIVRTYAHLAIAIAACASIDAFFFVTGIAEAMAGAMLGVNWLFVLGAFVVVGWLATRTAHSARSLPAQYLALSAYVVAQAVILVPMLYIARAYSPNAIELAIFVTLGLVTALTAIAFITRTDFSFLRGGLMLLGFVALGLIVGGAIFGLELGTWFSAGMIAFAGLAVLYDTSNVLHHYSEDRYVGASLELFASIAMMFWYVLRLFMSRD